VLSSLERYWAAHLYMFYKNTALRAKKRMIPAIVKWPFFSSRQIKTQRFDRKMPLNRISHKQSRLIVNYAWFRDCCEGHKEYIWGKGERNIHESIMHPLQGIFLGWHFTLGSEAQPRAVVFIPFGKNCDTEITRIDLGVSSLFTPPAAGGELAMTRVNDGW